MTTSQPSLSALFTYLDSGETGEFVCVSSSFEIHVYLRAGRIAWAIDSAHPFAFSRHLLENTTMKQDTFNEVLEACRRDRLPLGETLMAWEVITLEELQSALRHQIAGALATLGGVAQGRTIFLERKRQFASYDMRLTFDARELVTPPPLRFDSRRATGLEDAPASAATDRFAADLPDAAWLELFDDEVVLARSSAGVDPRVSASLLRHTLLDGANLTVVRGAGGTVLGAALPEKNRTLWCGLRPETAFAASLSTLCQLGGIAQSATPIAPPSEGWGKAPVVRTLGDADRSLAGAEMRAFMERAPEVEGIVLLEEDAPICGASRRWVDADWMRDLVRRRSPSVDIFRADPATMSADLEEQDRFRIVLTGEARAWCFGAELPSARRRTLWMITGRHVAQGLGWAYMTSLARQITSVTKDGSPTGHPRSPLPRIAETLG